MRIWTWLLAVLSWWKWICRTICWTAVTCTMGKIQVSGLQTNKSHRIQDNVVVTRAGLKGWHRWWIPHFLVKADPKIIILRILWVIFCDSWNSKRKISNDSTKGKTNYNWCVIFPPKEFLRTLGKVLLIPPAVWTIGCVPLSRFFFFFLCRRFFYKNHFLGILFWK